MLLRSSYRLKPVNSLIWRRFKHSPNKGSDNEAGDSQNNKALNKKESHEVKEFKVSSTSSLAAPAPLENSQVMKFMKKNNTPYIPKLKHERLSFDSAGLPNQDDFTKQSKEDRFKPVKRYTRYIPHMITAVVVLWAGYTVKVWMFPGEEGSDSQELLDPRSFHTFIVTHKEQIDEDHYLVELMPKFNHWQYSFSSNYSQKSIWNGERIWSVEVKQPQIMVARSYTPLPLYFLKSEYTRSGERKPLLKVIRPNSNDYDHGGVMTLYVKRYNDGEVSKFITDKSIGDELELRGPNIEYKIPYHPLNKVYERPEFKDLPSKVEPETYRDKLLFINKLPDYDNMTFYAAGTGIAPILQVLMSNNPYRGYVTVHYSARKSGELANLERFMFFLEKLDRVKFVYHYDTEKNYLTKKDVEKPSEPNYISPMRKESIQKLDGLSPEDALKLRKSILDDDAVTTEDTPIYNKPIIHYENALEQARITSKEPKSPSSLAIVCGPDGYVDYVSGPMERAINEQGPVGGLLGEKGWDNTNTFKLSN